MKVQEEKEGYRCCTIHRRHFLIEVVPVELPNWLWLLNLTSNLSVFNVAGKLVELPAKFRGLGVDGWIA